MCVPSLLALLEQKVRILSGGISGATVCGRRVVAIEDESGVRGGQGLLPRASQVGVEPA